LMIAHSKGFILSPELIHKILHVIYQVASCPYVDDHCCSSSTTTRNPTDNGEGDEEYGWNIVEDDEEHSEFDLSGFVKYLRQQSFHRSETCLSNPSMLARKEYSTSVTARTTTNENNILSVVTNRQYGPACSVEGTWIYSLLLRKGYGGLRCDVRLLQLSAYTWYRRCFLKTRADQLLPPLGLSKAIRIAGLVPTGEPVICWDTVLQKVYEPSRMQSIHRVSELISGDGGIMKIVLSDITIEGVDFHCSQILNHLTTDDIKLAYCVKGNSASEISTSDGTTAATRSALSTICTDSEQWQAFLRRCIWKFASGVNYRLPFVTKSSEKDDDDKGSHKEIDDSTAGQAKLSSSTQDDADDYGKTASRIEIDEKKIWNEVLASKVKSYQVQYIQERLSW
jgi:hypothetical protein